MDKQIVKLFFSHANIVLLLFLIIRLDKNVKFGCQYGGKKELLTGTNTAGHVVRARDMQLSNRSLKTL